MNLLARLITVLFCALCALGVAKPDKVFDFADSLLTPTALYIIAVFRILLGSVLIGAAKPSRAPKALKALGVFVIVAGIATPLMGAELAGSMLEWWSAQGISFLRGWMVFGVTFWLLVLYGLTPRREAT